MSASVLGSCIHTDTRSYVDRHSGSPPSAAACNPGCSYPNAVGVTEPSLARAMVSSTSQSNTPQPA